MSNFNIIFFLLSSALQIVYADITNRMGEDSCTERYSLWRLWMTSCNSFLLSKFGAFRKIGEVASWRNRDSHLDQDQATAA